MLDMAEGRTSFTEDAICRGSLEKLIDLHKYTTEEYSDSVSYTHLDVYKRQPTGGSSREYCTMGETLMQRRRVKEEGLRVVNFCRTGR